MARAALLSVSDRTGLSEFAAALTEAGFTLLTTSGTGKALSEAHINHIPIEHYTGQREILDGRVKTLHPKIHAGILANRATPSHLAELKKEEILPIDIVAVNLYPFTTHVHSERARDLASMIELIDVGGPTMLRAAAKNAAGVFVVIDPADYPRVVTALGDSAEVQAALRLELAIKVFTALAYDNLSVARYLAEKHRDTYPKAAVKRIDGMILEEQQTLRYGENPHQSGALFRVMGAQATPWKQLQGKELSYNNLLDLDAMIRLLSGLSSDATWAAIIKHLNPCGVASGTNAAVALQRAKECDPRSHFGGILGFRGPVDVDVAEEIREDFAEIVVASHFDDDARVILSKSKNLRLIETELGKPAPQELRSTFSGVLLQSPDTARSAVSVAECVTTRQPSSQELRDLELAWRLMGHVKSNGIVIVKEERTIGVGAGQMSRIDSVELAIGKARRFNHQLRGAVAASDAFFPFPDSITTLAEEGITAIIAPRGAKRDEDSIREAQERNVSLLFTGERHFRH